MATIFYPNSTQAEVQPDNGHDFKLAQLQAIVEGHIEIVGTRDGRIMVLNEEGKLLGLHRNEQATKMLNLPTKEDIRAMQELYGDSFILACDPDEVDFVVGIVLVCENDEVL